MKRSFTLLAALFLMGQLSAQLINEFEPNPPGGDPTNVSFELKGTPGTAFAGVILSIESDLPTIGTIDRLQAVSGTFDGNGLLVVTVPDLENPSFTVVLTGNDATAAVGTDLDVDNDGSVDDPSVLGTILDAIGIPDNADDADNGVYGVDLGGADFLFTGDEPKLVFRDGVNNQWYAINDPDGGTVFDITASMVSPMDFDIDPLLGTTFGSINPTTGVAPVALLDFKVAKRKNAVELSWVTANESGNDFFAIERSNDNGKSFTEIGRLDGAGNSRVELDYSFADEQPISGTSFYRLRQVDLDGSKTFFGPLSVRFSREGASITVYPNPATDIVFLENLPVGTTEVGVYNSLGRLLRTVKLGDSKSVSNRLDLSELPRGVYVLRLGTGSDSKALRLLKE